MNVSIRQLQGFVLVARLASFTRAAEQLPMTQAGLSAMIRDLEAQIGCRLFDRTTRSVSLTREGVLLLPTAERIVNDLHHTVASVRSSAARAHGTLTIAVTQIVAATLIPQALRWFHDSHPGIQVHMRDVAQGDIQPLVEQGRVDVGYSIFLRPSSTLRTQRLLAFRLLCIAPAGYLAQRVEGRAAEPRISWSHLPALPWIVLPPHTPIQQAIDHHVARVTDIDSGRLVCNSMQTMIGLVAAGQGFAILPSMVIPACPTQGCDLAFLAEPTTTLPFYQLSKKGHQLPLAVGEFSARLVQVVNESCRLGS